MSDKLLSYMEQEHLDSFFVTKPENVRYISRYTGDDSFLFITPGKRYFLTDPRYTEQAAMECPDYEIVVWRKPGNTKGTTIEALAKENGIKTIAFESDHLTYLEYQDLQENISVDLVPVCDVIETFRAVKTKQEMEYMRITCDIASRAFEKILKDIRVGVTEKELAAKLSYYMVMEGADTQPYGNILISGSRTSLLHGIPSSKALEYGDFVLMDYGCQYKGYMSDMTRTVVVGRASEKQREVYRLEQQMVADCLAVLKPGVTSREAYEASAKAVKGTSYEPYHYQGIGHGIGLFVHELPFLGSGHNYVLEENNVVTVEPGIYIPGWGGVRIEHQVQITADGYENLISATSELIEL